MRVGARVTRRHVLREKDGAGEQQVERFAQTRGWPPVGATEADQAARAGYERVWQTGTALTLHYAEDPIIRQGYVFLAGDDPVALPGVEAELLAAVDHWPDGDLLAAVLNAPDSEELGYALVRAALGAPLSDDPPLVAQIRTALRDGDPGLRKEAVLATTYTGWPVFLDELRLLLTWEDDDEARELAEAALRAAESSAAESVAESSAAEQQTAQQQAADQPPVVHHREGP